MSYRQADRSRPFGLGAVAPRTAVLAVTRKAAAIRGAVTTIQSGGGTPRPYIANGVDYGATRQVRVPGVGWVKECPPSGCVKKDAMTGLKKIAPVLGVAVAAASLIPGATAAVSSLAAPVSKVVNTATPVLAAAGTVASSVRSFLPSAPVPMPMSAIPTIDAGNGSSVSKPVNTAGWILPLVIGGALFLLRR